ncbi:phosphoribosylanthranilate isomerase [Gelidibacter sp.]|uniref:phosphoribosylanthranilate isomerase n=1 Tax=Gelidibacter sp. TaxID=2018083 RepID=UPI003265CC2D
MKYQDNITDIALLQPDYFGFIFYENSSRFFDGIIPQLPENIKKVGVFVNASIEEIVEKVEHYALDLVQLHGEETPEFCEELKRCIRKSIRNENTETPAFTGILKVFSIKDHFNFEQLTPYESVCDYYLFDTKGQLPGGNGYTFNWEVLKNYPSTKPYFLSGGIGLEEVNNINEFLRKQESQFCHAIDVNSKFEIEPGLKNITILKEFKNRIKPNLTGFKNL